MAGQTPRGSHSAPAPLPLLFPCRADYGYYHPYIWIPVQPGAVVPARNVVGNEHLVTDLTRETLWASYRSEPPVRTKIPHVWTEIERQWPTSDDEAEKARRLAHLRQEAWQKHLNKYTMRQVFPDLPARAWTVLERAGIDTPEALCGMPVQELRALRHVGRVTLDAIEQACATYAGRVPLDVRLLWDAWAERLPGWRTHHPLARHLVP